MSLNRRSFLTTLGIATTAGLLGFTLDGSPAYADALNKEQREKMTPDEIIAYAKIGNERSRANDQRQGPTSGSGRSQLR